MRRLLLTAILALGCVGLSNQAQAFGFGPWNHGFYDGCYPPPCCSRPFEGFYVGGNVGWAFHDKVWTDRNAWINNFDTNWALGTIYTTHDGFTGGIQSGYNWLCGCSLLGIELDVNWANLRESKDYAPSVTPVVALTLNDKLNWYGTIRGRAGIVANCLLLYGTAGAAYAHFNHRWTINDTDTTPNFESFSSKKIRWGFAVGTGAEWAVTQSISIKAEALYLRFPERSKSGFSPLAGQTVRFDLQNSVWIGRVGVNFNFSNCNIYNWL